MQDGTQGEPGWVFRPGDPTQRQENTPDVGILAVAASAEPEQTPREEAPSKVTAQSNASKPDNILPHVEWTASEYLANPKSVGWFITLAAGSILIALIIYLVTRDMISTIVIGILGVIVGIFAARQPRVLRYAIDNTGLHIEQKFYPYGSFKSFSIADDQPIHYISLSPLRRFMPPLVIHYDPADESKIMDTLAAYLPYEEHRRDAVDSLTRRFRF